MEIRRAGEGDAAELTQLARTAKASWGYPEAWLREWEPELTISAEYIAANAVFMVDDGDGPVGVVAVGEGPDGPEIAHLWIAPDCQGQGLGRRLVNHARQVAKEHGWSSLRILSDPYAQPFYERLGAVHTGDEPAPVAGTPRTLPVMRLRV